MVILRLSAHRAKLKRSKNGLTDARFSHRLGVCHYFGRQHKGQLAAQGQPTFRRWEEEEMATLPGEMERTVDEQMWQLAFLTCGNDEGAGKRRTGTPQKTGGERDTAAAATR